MAPPSTTNSDYGYEPHADQSAREHQHHRVVIAGAGMVGLTLAIDLVSRGVDVVLLEKGTSVSDGSRSICQAKRTLEIWDRLDAAGPMVERGITWNSGKVFLGDDLLYGFDLLPETGHKMPAFINLQQYHVENYLIERLRALGGQIRWQHEVVDCQCTASTAQVTIETPDGPYDLSCDWLVSAEGARSTVRRKLGLDFSGNVFEDKFLISDIRMKAPFPSERWFWFEPRFHNGQTALMHHQADDVWRIDLQLGWNADEDAEQAPDKVRARIAKMLGPDIDFEFEWISLYVFQCRTLDSYVDGPVIFVGDAAHQVSPFGARGGNGGVQDADNLAWKLDLVLNGLAPRALIDSYSEERVFAARENILHSTRATDFMTPKTKISRQIRDSVLNMAQEFAFARALVNPGRLSLPADLSESPLNTVDVDPFDTVVAPGSPAADAPLYKGGEMVWFIDLLGGNFTAVVYRADEALPEIIDAGGVTCQVIDFSKRGGFEDRQGLLRKRYDFTPGTTYLFRPDQHITGRWRQFDQQHVSDAVLRACCKDEGKSS